MSQKLPVNDFRWFKDISSINKKLDKFIKLIKSYGYDSYEGYILEADVEYPNQLVFEPNYHMAKWFSEDLLAVEMKKRKVKMIKTVYLGFAILEIRKTLMYEFWYDYIKPKYQNNARLCYMDNGNSDKNAKGTKKCVIKVKCSDYKDCLLKNEIILKSQQRFKSEAHSVYTEEINKIALSSSDNKRPQNFERITSYAYGVSVGKVCKTELLSKY